MGVRLSLCTPRCARKWTRQSLASPDWLLRPVDIMHAAFVGPVLRASDQSFANGILLYIEPFLRITLAVTQSMMPATRLEVPFGISMFPAKITFPISDPFLNGEGGVARRAKAVQVIRHQEVIADQPCRRFQPSLVDELPSCVACQPRLVIL